MSSMKNRGLVGLALVGALLAAGCPAPTSTPNTGNGNGNASPRPNATASPAATPTPATGGKTGEKEPNNDFDQAQALTLGEALSATASTDNQDYYKVTIPAGSQDGRLTVTINESSDDYTPFVELLDNGKNQINSAGASSSAATPFVITADVTAGQVYYIQLHEASGTAPYTIKADFAPVADTFERNDDFDLAKALTSGQMVDLYLFAGRNTNSGEDVDFFKIDVPEGQTQLKVEIDNKSSADEAQTHFVEVLNSAKEQVNSFGASGARANISQTTELPSAGTYYIKITASNAPMASKLTVTAM